MTQKEFAKIAAAIRDLYPTQKALSTDSQMSIWFTMLEDLSYQAVQAAVIKLASTQRYTPSIAEIRAEALAAVSGDAKDWGKAWQEVMDSIGPYGSYHVQAALDTFDDLTREAVERIGYRNICMSENIQTERANFRMIYEELSARNRTREALPPRYQALAAEGTKLLESAAPTRK